MHNVNEHKSSCEIDFVLCVKLGEPGKMVSYFLRWTMRIFLSPSLINHGEQVVRQLGKSYFIGKKNFRFDFYLFTQLNQTMASKTYFYDFNCFQVSSYTNHIFQIQMYMLYVNLNSVQYFY